MTNKRGQKQTQVLGEVWIPGRLSGLNATMNKARSNRYASAKQKCDETERCAVAARVTKRAKGQIKDKVDVACTWHVKNRRRDPDNVASAIKVVLDGCVKAGLLQGDGMRYIGEIHHDFVVSKPEGCLVRFTRHEA